MSHHLMNLRKASTADYPSLISTWESAISTNHDFLRPGDKEFYKANLPKYFSCVELFVATDALGQIAGFVGVAGGNVEMLFVSSEAQRLGVGSRLLDHAVYVLGATTVDVNEQNPSALQFYQHKGFEVTGRSATDADGKPYPLLHLQLKWHIRQEQPEDYATVGELIRQAFEHEALSDHTEHELVARLRHSEAFIPQLSLVATDKAGKIVGHILLTKVSVGSKTLLSLAPLSVLPTHQRQGIGSALIKAAHLRARSLGYDGIVVLGHKDYYPRFGYRKTSEFDIAMPFDADADYCMAIELHESSLTDYHGLVTYPKEFGI